MKVGAARSVGCLGGLLRDCRSATHHNSRGHQRVAAKKLRFGVGDILRVTIFEARPGGLFIPDGGLRQGNFITVPEQELDSDGNIAIPYAGTIRAAGRTAVQLQRAIEEGLKNRAMRQTSPPAARPTPAR
jgi:protein involved in polysaccharide export with SLBB domain